MTLIPVEAPPEGTVDLGELIDAVRALHVDLTLGDAEQPVPAVVETGPSTVLLPMVATSRRLGLTVVKVLTDAQADGPLQQSTVLLLDATTGTRLAVLAGGPGTRMRTAAASAVATDALARGDSSVLGLVGAGPLAVEHVAAIRRVRPIDHVVVWSRTARRIEEFRHTLRARERADGSPPARGHGVPGRPRRRLRGRRVVHAVPRTGATRARRLVPSRSARQRRGSAAAPRPPRDRRRGLGASAGGGRLPGGAAAQVRRGAPGPRRGRRHPRRRGSGAGRGAHRRARATSPRRRHPVRVGRSRHPGSRLRRAGHGTSGRSPLTRGTTRLAALSVGPVLAHASIA
ncbi:Ornithine cyclodeaminase [Pseudonocardia sp. Ae706_Ps2]|nr:Ornithine cyclodeaminase [Pseudonocardia sp. Ae706_Ps2]